MYKFSYFTQRANEVLNYAIKAAEDFGHNYIGSEHILLGLLKTDGGVAVNMLEEKGVSAEDIENLSEASKSAYCKENCGNASPERTCRSG